MGVASHSRWDASSCAAQLWLKKKHHPFGLFEKKYNCDFNYLAYSVIPLAFVVVIMPHCWCVYLKHSLWECGNKSARNFLHLLKGIHVRIECIYLLFEARLISLLLIILSLALDLKNAGHGYTWLFNLPLCRPIMPRHINCQVRNFWDQTSLLRDPISQTRCQGGLAHTVLISVRCGQLGGTIQTIDQTEFSITPLLLPPPPGLMHWPDLRVRLSYSFWNNFLFDCIKWEKELRGSLWKNYRKNWALLATILRWHKCANSLGTKL